MKAIPDSPVGVSCGLHCPPAPLWIIKGKPRVSQLRGKLSSAPKWNTDSYPPIYPFPSTRCSCGSAFTDLWLVFESSRRKQLFLWNTRLIQFFALGWGSCFVGAAGRAQHQGMGPAPCSNFPNYGRGESAADGAGSSQVTSGVGLRRSSQPPAAQGTHGKSRKRTGTSRQVQFPSKTLWAAEWHPGNRILLVDLSAKRYLDN